MCPSRWFSPIVVFLSVVFAVLPTASLAEGPTSTPAAVRPTPPASQPSDAAQLGVVRTALTQLYIVPRNPTAAWPDGPQPARKAATRPAQAGPPAITIDRKYAAAARQDLAARAAPTTAPAGQEGNVASNVDEPDAGLQQATNVFIESTPWQRTSSHISQSDREWADYRYYGGNPSRYGLGRYSRYGSQDYDYNDGGNYRFGFMQGYDYGRFEGEADTRSTSLMAHASVQLDRGVKLFHQGQYQQAADTFQLASETDQGDPISRIYAGHSLFALGRYRDAARNIRRAYELQPRIAYLTYDIRGDYDDPGRFEQQLNELGKALDLAPRDPDRLFLMGYVHYYIGQRSASYRFFSRLLEIDKSDAIAERLMRNSQPPDVEVDAHQRQQQNKK